MYMYMYTCTKHIKHYDMHKAYSTVQCTRIPIKYNCLHQTSLLSRKTANKTILHHVTMSMGLIGTFWSTAATHENILLSTSQARLLQYAVAEITGNLPWHSHIIRKNRLITCTRKFKAYPLAPQTHNSFSSQVT